MARGSSTGTILAAFALGALTGAVVALVYAPAPGDETRRRVAETARAARAKAQALARDGREFLERHRDDLAAAVERGRDAFAAAQEEDL
jgi:gas vesicle protein